MEGVVVVTLERTYGKKFKRGSSQISVSGDGKRGTGGGVRKDRKDIKKAGKKEK